MRFLSPETLAGAIVSTAVAFVLAYLPSGPWRLVLRVERGPLISLVLRVVAWLMLVALISGIVLTLTVDVHVESAQRDPGDRHAIDGRSAASAPLWILAIVLGGALFATGAWAVRRARRTTTRWRVPPLIGAVAWALYTAVFLVGATCGFIIAVLPI